MPQSKKFNRTRYFTLANVGGVNQLDLLSFRWNDFPQFLSDKSVTRYKIRGQEAGRLDLISYREYRTVDLWWVLAVANNIKNPFEVQEGSTIIVPSLIDIEAFYQRLSREQRTRVRSVALTTSSP